MDNTIGQDQYEVLLRLYNGLGAQVWTIDVNEQYTMGYIWTSRQSWSDKYVVCILFCLLSKVYRVWNGLTGMFRPWRVELVHGNPVYGYYVSSLQVCFKQSGSITLQAWAQDGKIMVLLSWKRKRLRLALLPSQHLMPLTSNEIHGLCNSIAGG